MSTSLPDHSVDHGTHFLLGNIWRKIIITTSAVADAILVIRQSFICLEPNLTQLRYCSYGIATQFGEGGGKSSLHQHLYTWAAMCVATALVLLPTSIISTQDSVRGDIWTISAGVIALNKLLLSILIGYRIFAMSNEVVAYLGLGVRNLSRTVIAATLESGFFYSSFLSIVFFLDIDRRNFAPAEEFARSQAFYTFLISWTPIEAIASTVIIVRVALGIGFNDVESVIVSMRVGEHCATPVFDISRPIDRMPQRGRLQSIASSDNSEDIESQWHSSNP
ncbi:hypothetical protein Moror_11097 [Moniliophthora roreri MCA 2997]|uniref:Uncharacterized protein n=1 Tax=Moniliophthora roreri (strain MCA 2997) TaxID=1381753 RepID=V2WQC7_MONRO|nr:hypothetical protein Moror_11097 [Moniliophthora roreri MCA 2997]